MCGLVAVVQKKITQDGRSLFKDMLYMDVVRGKHSTGVISVDKDDVHTYKKAMPAWDFLELPAAQSCIFDAEKALVGHNRHATTGAHTYQNAHPFSHNGIHLVHNGTLRNKYQLEDHTLFATDSEAIAWNLSYRNAKEVLESLEGAYALIWVDETDNSLHIAKNDERTLHCFEIQGSKTEPPGYALCSEEGMGDWLIPRNHFDILSDYKVPNGKHIVVDLDTHVTTMEDFEVKKPYSQGWSYGRGQGQGYRPPNPPTPLPNTSSTESTKGTGASTEKKPKAGGRKTPGVVYDFPRDMHLTFEVEQILGGTAYGFSDDANNLCAEFALGEQPQVREVVPGDVLRGRVRCIEDNLTALFQPCTLELLYKVNDVPQRKEDAVVCGVCDCELTDEEFTEDNVMEYCGSFVHIECFEQMDKIVGVG